MDLRVGDLVRVRTHAEILATLDERGCLDGLPFMPQMVSACGQVFRVGKSAHKMCDTTGGGVPRRMPAAVFLDDVRCDGAAYGGCEMECRIVWKTAWLEKIEGDSDVGSLVNGPERSAAERPLLELAQRHASNVTQAPDGGSVRIYACQAMQMPGATTALPLSDLSQYVEDVRSGNATVGQVISVLWFVAFDHITNLGLGFGSFLRWGYDVIQKLRGKHPFPARLGRLPLGGATPRGELSLQENEWVRIKSHSEILDTLNEHGVNRGMHFAAEMVPYCSQTYRVAKRLRRIVNERNGQLLELKNECIVLDGPPCLGRYARPLLCPRGMPPYWREAWLERTTPVGHSDGKRADEDGQ